MNQRVVIRQDDRQLLATVAWTGELPGKRGSWHGIAYDEPYGKHDGTYQGTRYFDCPPGYGSFVRETKIEWEMTLEEALKVQYSRDIEMEHLAGQTADSRVYFNDKQLDQLRSVSVNELPVKTFKTALVEQCPNLDSFDCSACPIESWSDIDIALRGSRVTHLSCSRMRLKEPNFTFENVTTLSMCNAGYAWEDIVPILTQFPNLQRLNLSGNKITTTDSGATLPSGIVFTDLSNNPVNDFDQLARCFGQLASLDELNLVSCQIKHIGPLPPNSFPALRTLVLAENPLETITSFTALNQIKSLSHLSVRGCTVYKQNDETIKQEIIARIGSLAYLNRSFIPSTDAENTVNSFISRRGAEIDFLNRRFEEWEDTAQWHEQYPRWKELIARHGEPIKIVKIDTTLNALTIKITLSSGKEQVEKELLRTTQMKIVYLMFKKLFKLKLKPGHLCYGAGKHKLEKMDWSLADYAIDHGDTICPV